MSDGQTETQDPGANRLEDRLDALLHLLDRQVVDCDGRMVGKVDDLELTEREDQRLDVTGILTGPAALVPRLGGNHDRGALVWWQRLAPARGDRDVPGWIDLDDVDALGSGVTLKVRRDQLVRPQPDAPAGTPHRRLADMLGMRVLGPDGQELAARVTDVRLEPAVAETGIHPRVLSLITGRIRPGLLLGYDRAQVNGPWLIAKLLGRLNRYTQELPWDDLDRIDWDDRTVHARVALRPLRPLHEE
jgi:sporulation protein YlmC with PRC-barrel domain